MNYRATTLQARLNIFVLGILVWLAAFQVAAQSDRIVYSAYTPWNWDIYYFDRRGEAGRRLTQDPGLDYEPAFSTDGRWLVFTSERRGSPDLFALDLQEENATPLLLIDSDAMEDQAAFSPDGETLFFVSTRDGNADIFTLPFLPGTIQSMDGAANITRHPGGDFRPAVSPDGSRVAFSTDRDTPTFGHQIFPFARQREGEIYVMDVDGINVPRRITHMKGWDGSPVWSDDSQTLFFYSAGGRPMPPQRTAATQEGGFRIWSVELENPVPRPLSPEGVEALWPTKTADGRIAFATRSEGGYDASWRIVSVNMDGSDLRDESDTLHNYWAPEFSAVTGAMVVHGTGPMAAELLPGCGLPGPLLASGYPISKQFQNYEVDLFAMRHAFSVPPHPTQSRVAVNCADSGGGRIITANLDGTDPQEVIQLEQGAAPGANPFGMKWSKDGEWITYMVGRFAGSAAMEADIRKVRPDGSEATNLSLEITANDGMPDYSRDGQSIVFRSSRSGNFDLYLMAADTGAEARQLTDDPAKDNFPVFSPSSDLIAFVSDRDGIPDAAGYREFDIYTLEPGIDGDEPVPRRRTAAAGQDSHVQFSPDGEWLIFTSERGGINDEEPLVQEILFSPQMYGEIYALRLSDGHLVRLTHNKWEDGAPFWVGPASADDL